MPSVNVRRISLHLGYTFSPQPSYSAVVLSSLRDFIFLTPDSPEGQSAEKQAKRLSHAHLRASPPGKKQRRDRDTFRGKVSCVVYGDKTAYRKFHQLNVDFEKQKP